MTNKQIVQHVEGFRGARKDWLETLSTTDSVEAAKHVMSINSKIELLLTMWNWHDESVEYHYPWRGEK
jgi:hypothetical protein